MCLQRPHHFFHVLRIVHRAKTGKYMQIILPETNAIVFKIGTALVILVAADKADEVLRWVRAQKQKAWLIGQVAKGRGVARMI